MMDLSMAATYFFPWLYTDGSYIQRGNIGHLRNGRWGTIIIYIKSIQHGRTGFPGPDFGQFRFQMVYRLFHPIFRIIYDHL